MSAFNLKGLYLISLALLLGACPTKGKTTKEKTTKEKTTKEKTTKGKTTKPTRSSRALPDGASLYLDWDPKTGKGEARQIMASGDILRTCFQCKYKGYTGGLVIGNYNGSGYGMYPRTPIRRFPMINVFCAQDESIWDRDEKKEYTYGWSENFGKGDDGEMLTYVRGRILDQGPRRLILQSENAGGCYRVTKLAYTRLGARWWILATRITNRCKRSIRFSFFSGDDPWIGMYRSAEGDVGWTPDGLVRHEKALLTGQFTAGGIYDLGNRATGEKEGSFSNQANFFQLDPVTPLPDLALFANSFAHGMTDIDPKRPLDSKSLTALNMGWTDRTLAPGKGLTVAMALGLATTGRPGSIPRVPTISTHDWSVWRRYLKEGNRATAARSVEFAAERVELSLTRDQMEVSGLYHLRNLGPSATSITITYPILTSARRPAPKTIWLDGKTIPVQVKNQGLAEARFPVQIPPHSLASFLIRYTQHHEKRRAVYMVTSARSWPSPIDRAVFIIRHPHTLGRVKISYPVHHTRRTEKEMIHTVVQTSFKPDREMEVRW